MLDRDRALDAVSLPPWRDPALGRWLARLALVLAVVLAGAWAAAPAVVAIVSSPGVAAADRAAWTSGHAAAGPFTLGLLRGVTDLHGSIGILVLAALGTAAWWRSGRPDAARRLAVTVIGIMALNALVKLAVHRVRPDWGVAVPDLPGSFSFPSGHVAQTTGFYGALAIETWRAGVSVARRLGMVALAVVAVLAVATSRIVLGMHFLSDCVGAVVECAIWLAACFWRPTPEPRR